MDSTSKKSLLFIIFISILFFCVVGISFANYDVGTTFTNPITFSLYVNEGDLSPAWRVYLATDSVGGGIYEDCHTEDGVLYEYSWNTSTLYSIELIQYTDITACENNEAYGSATIFNSGSILNAYTSTTSTTTTSTTLSLYDNGDLVFMLSIIVFFLSTFWVGYIVSMFRKTS